MKSLLVVVDMVNGFITEGALHDESIANALDPIIDLIEDHLKENNPILAFRDAHPEDALEFASFPPHCLINDSESELVKELKPYEDKMTVLPKNSTNGFMQPDFLPYFQSLEGLEQVVVTGCCTDICVLQFALSLKGYCNQHNIPLKIIVPADTVDTFGGPGHDKTTMNQTALALMSAAGICVTDTYGKE
ncbi:MAG: cysteine hydrolase [Erysipelotrichaceae bacterium]|nr:cysteine hydrolase [Erysipelotrichaceae bacterium]